VAVRSPAPEAPVFAFYRLATIGWANPLLKLTIDMFRECPGEEVVVDLSEVTFIDAFGVTYLAACLHRLDTFQECRRVWIRPPRDQRVNQHLQNVGFYESIGLADKFQARQPSSDRVDLIHVRELEPGFIDSLLEFLAALQPFGDGVRASIRMTLIELLQNFVEHSHSEGGAWICGQLHPRPKGSTVPRITLCFLDLGIGIPGSLKTVPKYSKLQDEPLIELSVEDGVSAREGARGRGLTMIHRFVKINGGSMAIVSNRGRAKFPADRRPIPEKLDTEFPGAAVFLSLKPTAKGLYEV
jgi:anti-anti-sigma regulatory factor/anti-sigma regulatory factor (Ser/Thr protein kinase)